MRKVALALSLILVFSIPWENAITLGRFGTLTRFIGVLTTVACFGAAMEIGFRKLHLFHALVFAFITWNLASYFWSPEPDYTIERIKTYIQLIILSWIFWELYTKEWELSAALQAYVLGGYVVIVSTIFNFLYNQTISEYQYGRYAGAGLDAVDQALILTLGLPIAWHLATSCVAGQRQISFRFINYAYIPLALFTIILTGSRTGLMVCIPAVLYILCTSGKMGKISRIVVYGALLVSTLFAAYHIPAKTVERLATLTESIAKGDLGGRGALWKASFNTFSNHPMMGSGSGTLLSDPRIKAVAHNTFLSVMAELGLIGVSIFIVIIMIVAFQASCHPNPYKSLWLALLLIWLVGTTTLTWEYRKPTWLIFNLIVISANLPGMRPDPQKIKLTGSNNED